MNITYKLQGVKAIKKLSVRFFHNKLDLSTVTNVMLMDSEWDSINQSVIGNSEVTIALQDLKSAILKQYNRDFCNGILIDKVWLQKVVKTSFMRPKGEDKLVSPDHTIYVSDFSTWWLENKSSEWSVSAKKKMGVPLQNQYKKFVKTFIEYENVIGEKLQLRNIRVKDLESFAEYLETENYQVLTIERQVGRLRFFLNRALEHNIEIDKSYKQRIYLDKEEDIEGVYLNEKEIQKIVDQDFSDNYELNITKQNFLIGIHTGLRISDFLRLDTSHMSEGVFKIKTKKTGARVVVPIHPIVRKVIDSNFGNLPPKVSSSDFNINIKTICQVCEIDYQVYGKLFDKDLKRKKIGYFKKYQLISSHVCRRSFATNNYGKFDEAVIKSVCGWSKKSKQLEHYNKMSKLEYAEIMQNNWDNGN
jgi:integrase